MLFFKAVLLGILLIAPLMYLCVAAPAMAPGSDQMKPHPKRGAAYNDITLVMVLSGFVGQLWAYNWDMSAGGVLPPGVKFFPMLWGPKMFSRWTNAIEVALASGSQFILGFNEPDNPAQANLSPGEAVSYYKQYISPYSNDATLVSPAVTNSGLSWMRSFMSSCTDCRISIMAVHWYGESAEDFKDFVIQAIDTARQYNIQRVWITEFALNSAINGAGDTSGSVSFLQEVIPWLDRQDAVTRYAYFMCANGFLLHDGSLSDVGRAYTASYKV